MSARVSAQDSGQDAGQQQAASQGTSPVEHGRKVLDQISAVFEQAAATLNPSVVAIYSEATVTVQSGSLGGDALRQFFGDQFLQRYFGQMPGEQQRTVHALGSGVIASADGYILTNNHVVENAQKLTVVLPNGEREPAKIVGTDPETDLALIKVDGHDLPAATFGDSDNVKIGQWVIAVGNPFELLHTTTAGIVSAKGRSSVGITPYEDFIQTDAAINP
ncbi:MAG TPA: trypsin-like peptidase domain-containing protein, partial [Gammaproteobacteria bacterium]|nr:trypsin-like peptidase domain-containing protein [Gammaproteobacteria bacterium]